MEIKKSIENLTKYVEIDKKYRKTDDDKSDFDKFCDEHINDIEILLKYVEELDKKFQYAVPDEIVVENYISKDKIIEILGLEENEDMTEEKILNYIDILVSENNRLEDIEDKKVQIEYQNVFNKGVKSVEKKIQEKIEDYTEKSKHSLVNAQSRREYTFGIKTLQELLEEGN